MDEAFDVWTVGKEAGDYHLYFKDWWQRDLETIIKRDRNHPSIVIYSLGNEIWDILPLNPDPAPDANIGPPRSIAVARNIFIPMRALVLQLDPTRPVTLAILRPNVAGIYDNGFAELMDVVGQNYRDNELAAAHTQNPARKIIGTENYHERPTWIALRDNPALAGQFLWTGADYLGEARWPGIATSSGLLDRTNLPKNHAFERASWWSTKPVLYAARAELAPGQRPTPTTPIAVQAAATNVNAPPVRPPAVNSYHDWTPAAQQPHAETINVYSNCEQVELFFNDRSLGSKPINADASPRQWQIDYQPGTLKAVAKNKGQVVATDELRTAVTPVKIVLEAEASRLRYDWDSALCVRAFLQDANGTLNPLAANKVTFSVTGPGVIAAVDNGDPQSHEPFQGNQRTAFHGTCIACLRATANAGEITLTASADGLTEGVIKIQAVAPVK
jgi:beta-galactosidase